MQKKILGKVNRGCSTKDICDGNTLCKTCVGATCNNKDFERPSCATDDGGEKKCEGLCYIYVNGNKYIIAIIHETRRLWHCVFIYFIST